MHILVLSHYFPPEVNAAANRIHEMGRTWVQAGHRVTVVTCAPNHPRGVLYPGYRNRLWRREKVDGIEAVRVSTFLAANEGFVRRTLNYASYFFAANIAAPLLPRPDVVISTSPQFFCGLAGYTVAAMKRRPWVFEVRDLWPESIVAVGAMRPNPIIRGLQALESFAYRHANRIVPVSEAFLPHLQSAGAKRERIEVITNGIDFDLFQAADGNAFRAAHGLSGKFVVGYIGTHGMAHALETILFAAERLRDRQDIAFVLVGDGAERARIEALRREMDLPNVMMLGQIPRSDIPGVWAALDASVVHLRKSPTFKNVIPSKMLEAFAAGTPVLLGLHGTAKDILLEGPCGIVFPPEDPDALARAVAELAGDRAKARALGDNGRRLARERFDRERLAMRYLELLEAVIVESASTSRGKGTPS
jgi:glycosyltransferase involved in cell wall biosynthesis